MTAHILVIDDEPEVRRLVSDILKDEGYKTQQASNEEEALEIAAHQDLTMVFLDLWLAEKATGGMVILEKLHRRFPEMPIVMISGHGTIETALDAVRRGAYDFIEKPFTAKYLLSVTRRACERALLKKENLFLRQRQHCETALIGVSPSLKAIQRLIDKAASTNSRIFIHSPVGSEGETVARLIHEKSARSAAPFLVVNGSMNNVGQLERALFGEENAVGVHAGLLEQATGGTLFLDDVTDLPPDIQVKLLRVLQDGTFTRVGGKRSLEADVRILSATSLSLQDLQTGKGQLRKDLYYRLNIVSIDIPPLTERREDILPLIDYFLVHAEACYGLPSQKMSAELLSVLRAYHWPGNRRQVRNIVEWILIMFSGSEEKEIGLAFLPPEIAQSTEKTFPASQAAKLIALPLKEARALFERDYLMAQVQRFSGNISQTAAFVGMERSALHRKLKSLQIPVLRHEVAEAS
ncbi:MAG: sigma-54 dependent transcriptional regulator [Holosporales bacterium]|jgi:two-component system nitrogen regulation response regulator NtrX|nr:sigma-54 dependent transcriptional regulator [Holosporales bacterium]